MDQGNAIQWLKNLIFKPFFGGGVVYNIHLKIYFDAHCLWATILFSPMLCFEYISGLGILTIEHKQVVHIILPCLLIGQ